MRSMRLLEILADRRSRADQLVRELAVNAPARGQLARELYDAAGKMERSRSQVTVGHARVAFMRRAHAPGLTRSIHHDVGSACNLAVSLLSSQFSILNSSSSLFHA